MKISYFVHSTTTDNENAILSGWSNPGFPPAHKKVASIMKEFVTIAQDIKKNYTFEK